MKKKKIRFRLRVRKKVAMKMTKSRHCKIKLLVQQHRTVRQHREDLRFKVNYQQHQQQQQVLKNPVEVNRLIPRQVRKVHKDRQPQKI